MSVILIVEDDDILRLLLKTKLSYHYKIEEASDGNEALDIMDHKHIELLLVDVQMPGMNGYELLRTLRNAGYTTPVIILTAMNSHEYKKEGFGLGADDYMTKPIDYEELTWRIDAILRRADIANEKKIKIGEFLIDQDKYYAEYDGEAITLTSKEFELLFLLLSYPDVVFTKQKILDKIWGYDTETENETIKTYICRLRNKFSECDEFEIKSIRGLGYKAVVKKERYNE